MFAFLFMFAVCFSTNPGVQNQRLLESNAALRAALDAISQESAVGLDEVAMNSMDEQAVALREDNVDTSYKYFKSRGKGICRGKYPKYRIHAKLYKKCQKDWEKAGDLAGRDCMVKSKKCGRVCSKDGSDLDGSTNLEDDPYGYRRAKSLLIKKTKSVISNRFLLCKTFTWEYKKGKYYQAEFVVPEWYEGCVFDDKPDYVKNGVPSFKLKWWKSRDYYEGIYEGKVNKNRCTSPRYKLKQSFNGCWSPGGDRIYLGSLDAPNCAIAAVNNKECGKGFSVDRGNSNWCGCGKKGTSNTDCDEDKSYARTSYRYLISV